MKGRLFFWVNIVILLMGCNREPTPTAVSIIETATALSTSIPATTPTVAMPATFTPVPVTALPPSATPVPGFTEVFMFPVPTRAIPPTRSTQSIRETLTAAAILPSNYEVAELRATIVAQVETPYTTLFVDGKQVYIGHGKQLEILDVSDPERPMLLSRLPVPYWIKRIQVVNGIAYLLMEVPDPEESTIILQAVDVSDPQKPVERGSYTPDFQGVDAVIIGGVAHVIGLAQTWEVVDISDPDDLVRLYTIMEAVERVCTAGIASYLAVDEIGGYLHLSYSTCRFPQRFTTVYDVSSPDEPEPIGFIRYSIGVAYRDGFAYAYGLKGIRVEDISERLAPVEVNELVLEDMLANPLVGDIQLFENVIYLTSADGLFVCEITEENIPVLARRAYTDLYLSESFILDDYLYLLDWENGLLMLDVTDPIDFVEIGRWPG